MNVVYITHFTSPNYFRVSFFGYFRQISESISLPSSSSSPPLRSDSLATTLLGWDVKAANIHLNCSKVPKNLKESFYLKNSFHLTKINFTYKVQNPMSCWKWVKMGKHFFFTKTNNLWVILFWFYFNFILDLHSILNQKVTNL